MNLRFRMTPVPGPVTVEFAEDYRIDVTFLDVKTDEIMYDASGEGSLLMSKLLGQLPAEAIAEIVRDRAIDLVKRAEGIA